MSVYTSRMKIYKDGRFFYILPDGRLRSSTRDDLPSNAYAHFLEWEYPRCNFGNTCDFLVLHEFPTLEGVKTTFPKNIVFDSCGVENLEDFSHKNILLQNIPRGLSLNVKCDYLETGVVKSSSVFTGDVKFTRINLLYIKGSLVLEKFRVESLKLVSSYWGLFSKLVVVNCQINHLILVGQFSEHEACSLVENLSPQSVDCDPSFSVPNDVPIQYNNSLDLFLQKNKFRSLFSVYEDIKKC